MGDDFQIRKDIEKLYSLIYARTTDSPVTQKSEFDAYKDSVIDTFVSVETFQDFANQVLTSWETIYSDNNILVERNGIHIRTIFDYASNITITANQWSSLVDLANENIPSKFFPKQTISAIGANNVVYQITNVGLIRATNYSSTVSLKPKLQMEWTI